MRAREGWSKLPGQTFPPAIHRQPRASRTAQQPCNVVRLSGNEMGGGNVAARSALEVLRGLITVEHPPSNGMLTYFH